MKTTYFATFKDARDHALAQHLGQFTMQMQPIKAWPDQALIDDIKPGVPHIFYFEDGRAIFVEYTHQDAQDREADGITDRLIQAAQGAEGDPIYTRLGDDGSMLIEIYTDGGVYSFKRQPRRQGSQDFVRLGDTLDGILLRAAQAQMDRAREEATD